MSVRRIAQRLPKLAFHPAATRTSSTPFLSRATSTSPPSLGTSTSASPSPSSSTPSYDPITNPVPSLTRPPPKVKQTKEEKALARSKKQLVSSSSKASSSSVPSPSLPTDLRLGSVGPNRLSDFYSTSLADDLLYLTYNHRLAIDPDLPDPGLSAFQLDPTNRYAINRMRPPPKGTRGSVMPVRKATSAENLPILESIVLNVNVKEAITQKAQLLGALHMLRTISGQVEGHRGDPKKEGVTVLKAKMGVAQWSVRDGMATGCKLRLEGDEMWRFLETLTEFVFPRLREWKGLRLPDANLEDVESTGSTSGVVAMGLNPPAMALFPQIEACLDAYPRLYGMNISFLTNQRGRGAANRARLLMSGFRVPFWQAPPQKRKAMQVWKKGKLVGTPKPNRRK